MQIHHPVYLRSITLGSADNTFRAYLVYNDIKLLPYFGCQKFSRDLLLQSHETVITFLLNLFRNLVRKFIGSSIDDITVGKTPDTVKTRFSNKIKEFLELILSFPRETDYKC